MSAANTNILKSLAALEQNLNDINSAKEQVNEVIKTSGNLAKVIETYQSSFESLSINVKAVLEDSRKFNFDSISKLSEQTKFFSKEIAKITDFDISKSLKSIDSKVVKQFHQNISKPIENLEEQTKNIEKEVSKLIEFDFKESFNKIENEIVEQFNINLKEKLISFNHQLLDLQSKIEELKFEIVRIEAIDLESHFKEISTIFSNQIDNQNIELIKNYEEVKNLGANIYLRLDQQNKEIETLKTLMFLIIGIAVIGIILSLII